LEIVEPGFSFSDFTRAVRVVLGRHEAPRVRFVRAGDGVRQTSAESDRLLIVDRVDDVGQQQQVAEDAAFTALCDKFHRVFDLEEGPLAALVYVPATRFHPARLLFNIHHLISDGISIAVLLEEFQDVYRAFRKAEPAPDLPPAGDYSAHLEALRNFTNAPEAAAALTFWQELAWSRVGSLPTDKPDGSLDFAHVEKMNAGLPANTTAQLLRVHTSSETSVEDILVTVLAHALHAWGVGPCVAMDISRHGRTPISAEHDPIRTVGWLASVAPHVLEPDPRQGWLDRLESITGQLCELRRHAPAWSALRYLSPDPAVRAKLAALPRPEFSFEFRGRDLREAVVMPPFRLSSADTGIAQTRRGRQPYQVKIWADVDEGQLLLSLFYSRDVYHRSTIQALADDVIGGLSALVAELTRAA
jgi:hypothetical protein